MMSMIALLLLSLLSGRIARTTYVDEVYCYRPSRVLCRSVGLSVSQSVIVTLVSPAKTAEPIEMPFGSRTRVGPGNHALDGGSDTQSKGAILGEIRAHCKYRDFLP